MSNPHIDDADTLHLLRAASLALEFKGKDYWAVRSRLRLAISRLEDIMGQKGVAMAASEDLWSIEVYREGDVFGYRLYKKPDLIKPVCSLRACYPTVEQAQASAGFTRAALAGD